MNSRNHWYPQISRVTKIASGILLFAIMAVPIVLGQTQAINGSIRGRVSDPVGAPVAEAAVKVENTQTGFNRTVNTGDDGYYVIANLPLGTYVVSIEKAGFNLERHQGVILDAGTDATIDADLKIGSVSTTVEVAGGAPVIDPSRVSTGRTIGFEETNNLPLTSRNPYNFILFQPGVSGHPNPELGIPRLLNTNGLVDHVNYQLDGTVDTETDRTVCGYSRSPTAMSAKFRPYRTAFAPEFGKIAGNIFNVITGSGSNQFHGQVQYIGRPLDLVARPILATPATLLPVANNFSANASGRLIKNKLFLLRLLRAREAQRSSAHHDHCRRMPRRWEFRPIC